MKKVAIGCGIALLLTGITAAGVAYYVYRQVASTVTQFAELAKVPDIEKDVRNRSAFVPPASEELTDSQVEKLVQVQSEVRRRLGERMTAFEAKYKLLAERAEKHETSIGDAPQLLKAYGDLANTWLDAKRGQVEALNAAGFSLEEYRWVRDQAYRALGMAFVDLDISKLVDEARRGVKSDTAGQMRGSVGPSGPESNRTRIERVRKQLEENLALASFGL
jgi:hypothetical protein